MDLLKLAALDVEDLTVISACVQDAVLKTGEISYNPGAKRLVLSRLTAMHGKRTANA